MIQTLMHKIIYNPYVNVTAEVGGELTVLPDNSRIKTIREKERIVTMLDSLTGLPNKKSLIENIKNHTLLYCIDLDNFSNINRLFGRDYGDKLLCRVAHALSRSGDAYRGNGDRFYVLAYKDIIPAIRSNLGNDISISIGIADISSADDPQVTIKNADMAMYRAKTMGKGLIITFKPEYADDFKLQHSAFLNIQNNIKNNFAVIYAPVFNVQDGHVEAYKARLHLAEIKDSRLAMEMYERNHIIIPLGKRLMAEAMDYSARKNIPVHISVSQLQIIQHDFITSVNQLLTTSKANPKNITLDLSESILPQRPDYLASIMTSLHRMGIRFAIDNFGSGRSSLSVLWMLSFDMIKASPKFMETFNTHSQACLKMVSDLGRKANYQVCVQGVNTKDKREFARSLGIQFITG